MKVTKKAAPKKSPAKPVIVRTFSAGVFFGFLAARRGQEVDLTSARRVWSWKGANTLSEMALRGIATGSKVADPVTVTLLQAIEVIDCAPEAVACFEAAKWA
jgi:hypothetical protein